MQSHETRPDRSSYCKFRLTTIGLSSAALHSNQRTSAQVKTRFVQVLLGAARRRRLQSLALTWLTSTGGLRGAL